MENDKQFSINQSGTDKTYVSVGSELGLILMRPEVTEIAHRFKSIIKREPGLGTAINIVPPLNDYQLPKLGEALVGLATRLDPSGPPPTYKIYQET